ncbi:MAG TPA: hypothetical protein VND96_18115 [Candidatus Micrarchaeaceae archaeon]|nr:hypothetical protein [Candidatus Micrarchaeaceae archaeon]
MDHSFHLGDETTSYVDVEVLSRTHDVSDYWDGNWLTSVVKIAVGPWKGRYGASLRAEEFAQFHDQLRRLYDDASAPPAQFDSMEPWLRFKVQRSDSLGHITIAGHAQAEPFFEKHNILNFVLDLDQTYLPSVLDELDGILNEFPVVGSPRG